MKRTSYPVRKYLEPGGFGTDRDDIIDAMVAALTAAHADACRSMPSRPAQDEHGLHVGPHRPA